MLQNQSRDNIDRKEKSRRADEVNVMLLPLHHIIHYYVNQIGQDSRTVLAQLCCHR